MKLSTTLAIIAIFAASTAILRAAGAPSPLVHRSPYDVAFSPEGDRIAVSDETAGSLVLLDAADGRVVREVALRGRPRGVAWSADGASVFVAECAAGSVAEVDRSGGIRRRLAVGPRPVGVAVAPRSGWLLVTNSGTDSVAILDLARGAERARVPVRREPWFVRVTADESLAVVGNRLPSGDASDPSTTAVVSLIELPRSAESEEAVARIAATHVPLPPNSLNVLGIALSPNGRWAYVLHNLGRTTMSTERISGGWINRNLLSVIDLRARRLALSTPLDSVTEGAANPWGAAVSPRGDALWISISGTHELGRLDLAGIDGALRSASDSRASSAEYGLASVYDLGVYTDGRLRRIPLRARGPRGLALSPDGSRLAVAGYFSGDVVLVDATSGRVRASSPVGPRPEADEIRRGEEVFHDAKRCYQSWLSCATCHPEGRADGLNWDLFNDGVGNPKNTRSLLDSHRTPPAMARGVRPDMETAAAAGFTSLLFREPAPDDLRAVEAYLRSLRLEPSPHLVEGALSAEARRGKELFERPDVGCAACHPPPLFTDLAMHDVGTRGALAWEDRFDTPTLIELWRTAPYLHHGRAKTLRDVLEKFNQDDRHGATSGLSAEEVGALVAYLRSL